MFSWVKHFSFGKRKAMASDYERESPNKRKWQQSCRLNFKYNLVKLCIQKNWTLKGSTWTCVVCVLGHRNHLIFCVWAVKHYRKKLCFWLHPLKCLLLHFTLLFFTSSYLSHITSVSSQVVSHIYHSPQVSNSILSLTNLSRRHKKFNFIEKSKATWSSFLSASKLLFPLSFPTKTISVGGFPSFKTIFLSSVLRFGPEYGWVGWGRHQGKD